jgi:hypothetical protein
MATNNANDYNNPLAIAQGGTNASSMSSTNGVVYYDGSSLVTTPTGVSMQLLTSSGTGNAPTWQAGGGGAPSGQGWDLIQSQITAVQFSIAFTGLTNAYNVYKLVYIGGNTGNTFIRYSTNGGSSYVTTGYLSTVGTSDTLIGSYLVSTTATFATLVDGVTGGGASGADNSTFYLFNVTNGLNCSFVGQAVSSRNIEFIYSSFNNGAAINALQIIFTRASTGKVLNLYGLNE